MRTGKERRENENIVTDRGIGREESEEKAGKLIRRKTKIENEKKSRKTITPRKME